jgi:hypothetical protein
VVAPIVFECPLIPASYPILKEQRSMTTIEDTRQRHPQFGRFIPAAGAPVIHTLLEQWVELLDQMGFLLDGGGAFLLLPPLSPIANEVAFMAAPPRTANRVVYSGRYEHALVDNGETAAVGIAHIIQARLGWEAGRMRPYSIPCSTLGANPPERCSRGWPRTRRRPSSWCIRLPDASSVRRWTSSSR